MEFSILLTKYISSDRNAGQKAPQDIEKIFITHYGKTYRVAHTNNKLLSRIDTIKSFIIFKTMKNKSECNLVVQWPLSIRSPFKPDMFIDSKYKRKIVIIHDIISLLFSPNDKSKIKKEIEVLNKFDYVVVHNKKMEKWLIENGLTTNTVNLNIFDYLLDDIPSIQHSNEYRLVIAGNLNKSSFLKIIDKVTKYRINAYGVCPSYELPKNVDYKGSFKSDELPYHIAGDFGLIWDGQDCDTCSGNLGNYMRFNNPHKLSLFVACGLPIITWKEAAIADYVEKNDIGFVIDNLNEIDSILDNITPERYAELLANVERIRYDVIEGKNTLNAIKKVIINE